MTATAEIFNEVAEESKPQLPAGWRWVKLSEVTDEAQHGFAIGERDSNGVIQLRMNNVTTLGQLDWKSFIRVPADAETIAAYRLRNGDVLFNNTNSTELVGKTALFENHDEPVVFSNHFTRIRTNVEKLDSRFLAFWLQQQWQRGVFANICNRWIGQSAVQRDKLLALEIPLPPLTEQKRIAGILKGQMAAVERARASAEAQLQAAEHLPAAYLRAVFSIPEMQAWPKKRLGDIAKTSSGSTPSRGCSDYFGGTIPWVKTGELRDGFILDTEEKVTEKALKECSLPLLPAQTLLVAMYGQGQTRGRTGLLTQPMTTNQACFAVLPNPTVFDSAFLQWWFRHSYMRLRQETESRGGNQPNLNGIFLREQEVQLPPLADQRRIAAQLSSQIASAERLRQMLTDQLDAINKLPAALLRRAFDGEL